MSIDEYSFFFIFRMKTLWLLGHYHTATDTQNKGTNQ